MVQPNSPAARALLGLLCVLGASVLATTEERITVRRVTADSEFSRYGCVCSYLFGTPSP